MKHLKSFLLVSIFIWTSLWATAADEKPNFLFIIADDATYLDLGVYGGQAHTPTLNQLASEGMKFNQCFQTSPMCSPTRHTIYTGLYPVKSGAYTNHSHAYDHVKSVVHYLKPLGYRVALSGKSHVSPDWVFPFENSRIKGERGKASTIIDMEAADTLMSESAANNQPFALFACSNEPHEPWSKGKEYRSLYDTTKLTLRPYMVDTEATRTAYRDYLAEISFFDAEVGQLLALLDKHDLKNNTLVMITSEQGNTFPFAKWTCYDAGLQSGLLVRWPGHVEVNSESDAMIEYVDILPTFIEAAGGIPEATLDGKSLLPILSGKSTNHKKYVYGLQTSRGIYQGPDHYAIRSIRNKQYKLILNLDPEARFSNTINKKKWFKEWTALAELGNNQARWVVERFAHRPAVELYDIQADPHEINNLAEDSRFTDVRTDLSQRLNAWMASQGDEGMKTEMAAFERMLTGNEQFKKWSEANGHPNQYKKSKGY